MPGKPKKQEHEKRTHIIQVILDNYENSKKDWMTYLDKEIRGNRTIKVTQELYDEIGKQELNRQVLELQKEGLLKDGKGETTSGWYVRGSELEKIVYRLQDIPSFYERDGRTPKYYRHYTPIRQLQEELKMLKDSQKNWKLWLLACMEALEQELEKERIPEICNEKKEIYFKTLAGLNELEEPLYKRIFSKKYLGGSKVFEENVQSRIIADARKWNACVEEEKEAMGNDEVLSEIGIETYHQELSVKGPLRLEIDGELIDTSAWICGAVLNADTLKRAKLCPQQNIDKIITIENKVNFMAAVYEERVLYIYSHGFLSPKERYFLRNLREVLADTKVQYYHSSDLDYGGIRIYLSIKETIFPEVRPLYMDAKTFCQYQSHAEKREAAYLQKVAQMGVPEELRELKRCILETESTIEQESMLLSGNEKGITSCSHKTN